MNAGTEKIEIDRSKLFLPARFALFITSYIPLFILLGVKDWAERMASCTPQDSEVNTANPFSSSTLIQHINEVGIVRSTMDAVVFFFRAYTVSSICASIVFICGVISFLVLKNLKKHAAMCHVYAVVSMENQSSNAAAYMASYIVPLALMQSNWLYNSILLLVVMLILFVIFCNSDLLLVNPVLCLRYAIFKISYTQTLPHDGCNTALQGRAGLEVRRISYPQFISEHGNGEQTSSQEPVLALARLEEEIQELRHNLLVLSERLQWQNSLKQGLIMVRRIDNADYSRLRLQNLGYQLFFAVLDTKPKKGVQHGK